jgi:hypothetical protein
MVRDKYVQLDLSDVNQDILLFSAFRYALGRRTYVVGTIINIIKDNWDHISQPRREFFKKEIREAIERDMCGSKYDIENWEEILNLED